MTILVYTSQQNRAREEIRTSITRALKDQRQLAIVDSVLKLRERLLQPCLEERPNIVLLHFVHQSELEAILGLQNLLRNMKLIIVLPEQSREIVTKAHKLHPRYLTFIHSDYSAVTDVLRKMLKNQESADSLSRRRFKQVDACA